MWTLFKNNHEGFFQGEDLELARIQKEEELSNYMSNLVLMLCEKPANVLGIEKQKGSIEKGKVADLVVFDPDREVEILDKDIYNRYPEVCIYRGKRLMGKVKETYLRGNLIFSDSNPRVLKDTTNGRVLKRLDYKVLNDNI